PEKQVGDDRPRRGATAPVIIDGPDFGRFPVAVAPMRLPPREMLNQLQGLPPLVATISREGDELRFEFKQVDPRNLRGKAINSWFEWFARNSTGGIYRGGIVYDGGSDLVPPPPIAIPIPNGP